MDRIYRLTKKTRDTFAEPSKPTARGDILPGTSKVGRPTVRNTVGMFSVLPCAPGGCMGNMGDRNLLHPAEAAPSPGRSRKQTSHMHWW